MSAIIEGGIILEGFDKIQVLKALIDNKSQEITNEYSISTLDFIEYDKFFKGKSWTEVENLREMPNLAAVIELDLKRMRNRFDYHSRNYSCWVKRTDTETTFWCPESKNNFLYICKVPTRLIYKINEVLSYMEELKALEHEYEAKVHKMRYPEQYVEKKSSGTTTEKKKNFWNDITWLAIFIWVVLLMSLIGLRIAEEGTLYG